MTEPVRYTPGPWRIDQFGDDGSVFITENDGPNYTTIATLFWAESPEDADATLIAAAPDLLEALERVAARGHEQRGWGQDGPYHDASKCLLCSITPVIAKAKGEQA